MENAMNIAAQMVVQGLFETVCAGLMRVCWALQKYECRQADLSCR